MRTVTVTEKYRAVQEGRMAKSVFLQHMKREYPFYISQFDNFDSSVSILKNKGMLFEEKKDDVYNKDYYKFSDEGVRRGTDAELTKMGIDSTRPGNISKEDLEKAKETALKNLRKDPLYYLNLLSGDSLHVDKHDKPVEYKKGNEKDVFNGMKKAELKEDVEKKLGASNGEISDLVKNEKHIKDKLDKAGKKYSKSYDKDKHGQKIVVFKLKEEVSEADAIPTEPGIPGQRASNHNRKMALRKVIDTLTKDGHPEKGYKVSNDEALSFIRTYKDEIFNGTIDFNNAEAVWDEYEESESVDRDSVDEQEVEEQMTDQQMKDIQNYGKADSIVKPFKPGDMWSNDFDYEGMLEAGLKVRLNTPLETMQALYSSFEDVNYHSENKHLGAAIDAKEEGDKSEALDHLRNFRKAVKETLLNLNEGGNPLRDVEEVMGYNRRGEKEEEPRPSNYTKVNEEEGKYSWEYDDQGYGALEAFFDDIVHKVGPEISLEDAKSLLDSRGEGGDDTKAFNQAAITQMQATDDDDMDKKSTQNMIQAYEEKYNEPFSTNLIKHLDSVLFEKKVVEGDIPFYNSSKKHERFEDIADYPVQHAFKKAGVDMGKPVTVTDVQIQGYDEDVNNDEMDTTGAASYYEEERKKHIAQALKDYGKEWDDLSKTSPGVMPEYSFDEAGFDETPDGHDFKLVIQYSEGSYVIISQKSEVSEKKGKDHDGDGDVDGDDYMAAKDKAIKKAMGKDVNEDVVRKNIKSIITKVLEEQTINEAATNQLSKLADDYGDFKGMQIIINDLENIVTDVESYYAKTKDRLQDVMDKVGDVSNPEGLKVGAFIAPAIEAAFRKDLRPVISKGFTKDLSIPKVQRITQTDINRGYVGEAEPKQTVFSPVNEKKK